MKKLDKIWQWLSGKKTAFGMLLLLITQGVQTFFPEALTAEQANFLLNAATLVGGTGLLHKAGKTKTAGTLAAGIKTNLMKNSKAR